MKYNRFTFFLLFVIFFVGCGTKGLQHNIKIQNDTSENINITSCDMTSSAKFPIKIEPFSKTDIIVEGPNESTTFYLEIKNKEFELNTGYIQDSNSVDIRITGKNSELKALKKYKNEESEIIFKEYK